MYSLLGFLSTSWPGRYVAHILARSRCGSLNQCVLQPHMAGDTGMVQPGQ
jgi:hypothetical protein